MVPRGGKRSGAGRPTGTGKYKEPTQAIRVPISMVTQIKKYAQTHSIKEDYQIPLYGSRVAAGFPSPADDYIEGTLDLNEHLISHPAATFFVRATGYSMINAGIHPGDILITDRSVTPTHGKVVVVAINGELTVKRLYKQDNTIKLLSENPEYPDIKILNNDELHVWGVVTNVVHQV